MKSDVRNLVHFWILFYQLYLFGCFATLIMLSSTSEVTPWELRIKDFLLSVLSPGMIVTNGFSDYSPCLISLPAQQFRIKIILGYVNIAKINTTQMYLGYNIV
jgi:hypothetical protein